MKKSIISLLIISFLSFCGKNNSTEIKAPGIIDGDIITVKSQVQGTIDKININEGKEVHRGDILVKINMDKTLNKIKELDIKLKEIDLNSENLKKRLKYVNSNLIYLKKQVKRFTRLKKTNSVSGEKLENMEIRYLEVKTSLFEIKNNINAFELQREKIENTRDLLNLILKDHIIKSPIDNGVVIEKFVLKGETVFPNTSIADILNVSSLYIEVFIEEQEISSLKLGMKVKILIDGIKNKNLSGTISYFGRKAEFSPKYIISEKERKSLLYQVKIQIEGNNTIFKIGMPVTIVFNKQ